MVEVIIGIAVSGAAPLRREVEQKLNNDATVVAKGAQDAAMVDHVGNPAARVVARGRVGLRHTDAAAGAPARRILSD